jgi:hypothetical protein
LRFVNIFDKPILIYPPSAFRSALFIQAVTFKIGIASTGNPPVFDASGLAFAILNRLCFQGHLV